MGEQAPSFEPGQQKRRSIRIVQAVPITVGGTDALGQPFKERTSTVVINSHGCKYQSKHYVLKNRWVTFEIPHPQQGREPRRVRARIVSIQRPRTVRELFQIGAELEVSGNAWGIAFPPMDWFEFPDAAPPPAAGPDAEPARQPSAATATEEKPRLVVAGEPDEAAVAMSRQMDRLLDEARQQVAQSVREAVGPAVANEASRAMHEISGQLKAAAGRAVDEVASSTLSVALSDAVNRLRDAGEAQLNALNQRSNEQVERCLNEATQRLLSRLADVVDGARKDFASQIADEQQHVAARLEEVAQRADQLRATVEDAVSSGEYRLLRLRADIETAAESAHDSWRQKLETLAGETLAQLQGLEEQGQKLDEEIGSMAARARAAWQSDIEADLAAAHKRWSDQVESVMAAAADRLAGRLAEVSQAVLTGTERKLKERANETRESVEAVMAQAAQQTAETRESLDAALASAQAWLAQIEGRASDLEKQADQMTSAYEKTATELKQRFEALLEAHQARLAEETESLVAGAIDRLQPNLDAAGQHSVAHFVAELEQQATPQMERVAQLLKQIAAAEAAAEQTTAAQQERLAETTEHALGEASTRLRSAVAEIHEEFEKTCRGVTARALEELETKTGEASHEAFESLFKTAEWYQRKAQAGMQSALDRALEQAATALREKAGEISSMFASELNHYSRSYAAHTRELVEDAAQEITSGARTEMGKIRQEAEEGFSQALERWVEEHGQRVTEATSAALDETVAQLAARTGQARAEMETHAAEAATGFEQRLANGISDAVGQAKRRIEAGLPPLMEKLRADQQAQEKTWQATLEQTSHQSFEQYRERLENVSNSWMVASATTLTQRSQAALEEMAASAEQRLREVMRSVVHEMAETLRRRLLGLGEDAAAAAGR